MSNLRLANESELPVVDYSLPPLFGWREFYGFRNQVIQTLRQFGSAGPCGIADLSGGDDDGPLFIDYLETEPDFFVVDDMYNRHDRLSLVESEPRHIAAPLLEALAAMAAPYTGWRIVLNLGDCGLSVFGGKVVVGGRRFWGCLTVGDLAARCAAPIQYGPAGALPETMYPLWFSVVTGSYRTSTNHPAPTDQEWNEVQLSLEALARRGEPGKPLKEFAYDRIRADIHPRTRAAFVARFLENTVSCPRKSFRKAKSNVLRDAGEAFGSLETPIEWRALARAVSAAQCSIASWSEAEDVVFWWPHILYVVGEPSGGLREVLSNEFRTLLTDRDPWVQLSALFCLAILKVEDIARLVDQVRTANPGWMKVEGLPGWLKELRTGATLYPSINFPKRKVQRQVSNNRSNRPRRT